MAYPPIAATGRCLGSAALAIAAGLIGCSQNAPAPSTPADDVSTISVVATNSVLCDLTRQIAADSVDLTCLIAPGQDPHTYQIQPSDRQALEQADLVLYGGYDSEPSILRSLESNGTDTPQVSVYEAAIPEPLMAEAHDHGDHHDHADHAEDTHDHASELDGVKVADPHIWHSAENNGAMAEVIAAQLAQTNPAEGDRYRNNAQRLSAEFTALHSWIQNQVNTVPEANRVLVTPHAAFNYYADAYGMQVKGALSGLSTAEKPSAAQVSDLVERVKAAAVPAIFAETSTSPNLIQTVAKEAGVTLAEQPLQVEGPVDETSTVQEMLVSNTCAIVTALGGTCDASTVPGTLRQK